MQQLINGIVLFRKGQVPVIEVVTPTSPCGGQNNGMTSRTIPYPSLLRNGVDYTRPSELAYAWATSALIAGFSFFDEAELSMRVQVPQQVDVFSVLRLEF